MGVLQGIPVDSSKGQGGIEMTVYLAPKSAVSGFTESVSGGTKGYASFASGAGVWDKFVFGKESASSASAKGTGDESKGSLGYEHTLVLHFRRNQNSKRNTAYILAQSEVVAAVKDNNGRCFILGGFMGLGVSEDSMETGAQLVDANAKVITLKGKEPKPEMDIFNSNWAKIVANTAITAG